MFRNLKSRRGRRVIGAIAVGAVALGGAATLSVVNTPAAASTTKAVSVEQQREGNMPRSFAGVVQQVSPAVVNIQVQGHMASQGPGQGPGQMPPEMRKFFERFFGQQMPQQAPQQMPQGKPQGPAFEGAGSGFIIDPNGYVVTNHHVIAHADDIKVVMQSGKTYKAKVVGDDKRTDLALLKIKSDKKLPYVKWGSSTNTKVGDWVIAIGNPFGLGSSVTAGIVSARGRIIGSGPYDDFLQIDAPINKGNSGGPTFNLNGRVVGINSAIFSPSGGSVGIGFAIPSDLAKTVIAELKTNGKVERGWLGVHIQKVTPDIADSLGLPKAEGALVADVMSNGPAKKAGFKAGDVITEVNGKPVKAMHNLPLMIADLRAGSTADIQVWRNGHDKTLKVEIGKMPGEKKVASNNSSMPSMTSGNEVEGMQLSSLDPQLRQAYGIDQGVSGVVVTGVNSDSPAQKTGLQEGDVILQAAGTHVTSPAQVEAQVKTAQKESKKAVLLRVKRGNETRFVALPVKAA